MARSGRQHNLGRLGWILAVAVCAQPAFGQTLYNWLPGEGQAGLDGPAYAMTTWDPDGGGPQPQRLVVAGAFSKAGGIWAHHIATWDGIDWAPLGSGMNGEVHALTVFYGQLIAAGTFGSVGGLYDIARWDGVAWQALGTGLGGGVGIVRAMTVYNNRLIVAGRFTTAGGVTCNNIASWDGTTWRALGTGMSMGLTSGVCSLAVYSNQLIAGGSFTTAGGVACSNIASWNGSIWQTLGTGMDESVNALSVYNNQLIAGGFFSTAGGVAAIGIACWDGTSWHSPGRVNGTVESLAIFDGRLIIGGGFATYGGYPPVGEGIPCNNIVSWDGANWETLDGGVGGSWPLVQALAVYGNRLIAAGSFTTAGGAAQNYIASWDETTWRAVTSKADGSVCAWTTFEGQLVAGGEFTAIGGVACRLIGRWDGTTWQPFGNGLGGGQIPSVKALAAYNGELIAAGGFAAGGYLTRYIARWNGFMWEGLTGGMSGPSPSVNALAVYDGELIAGGCFVLAGGRTCNNIARWNGGAWQPLGTGMAGGSSPCVNALTVFNGELIAGGRFTTAGGVNCYNLAAWNGTAWRYLGWTDLTVYALAVHDGRLIAGGDFTEIGGTSCDGIASWDGSLWDGTPVWEPLGSGTNGTVRCLAVYDGSLVAGGDFTTAGGASRLRIARWDGTAWHPMTTGVDGGSSPCVNAVTVYSNQLIAGGDFLTAYGASAYWARWGQVLSIHRQPAPLFFLPGDRFTMSVGIASGSVAYQWRKDGAPLTNTPTVYVPYGEPETLCFNPAAEADAGIYDVVISDESGSLTSDPAALTLTLPPDIDRDACVTVADLLWLVEAMGSEIGDPLYNPRSDFNHDGVIDMVDVLLMVDNFGNCVE